MPPLCVSPGENRTSVEKLFPGTVAFPLVPVASTWAVVDSARKVEVLAFRIFNLSAGIKTPGSRLLSKEKVAEADFTLSCQLLLLFTEMDEKFVTVFPFFTSSIVVRIRLALGFEMENEKIGQTIMLPLAEA